MIKCNICGTKLPLIRCRRCGRSVCRDCYTQHGLCIECFMLLVRVRRDALRGEGEG